MRKCPWCGRENLNVYAYCQSCGRGFEGPEQKPPRPSVLGQFSKYVAFLKPRRAA